MKIYFELIYKDVRLPNIWVYEIKPLAYPIYLTQSTVIKI